MFALLFGVLLLCVVVALGCWVGFHLLRQNGRLLLRLESLEQKIAPLVALAVQAGKTAVPVAQAAPQGLPIGSAAPVFELPTLSGERVSLADYRGKRTLLVFFNPGCGYCVQMAPDLAELAFDGRDGSPIPLIISTGRPQENQRLVKQHDIRATVLLQQAVEVGSQYKADGTPMGYLVDEEGRIASRIAVGAEALLVLARGAVEKSNTNHGDQPLMLADGNGIEDGNTRGHKSYNGNRPLADSRIKRDGLTAGTPAPDFSLPRVDGGTLSLADYRGRKVLLVFSDPQCGPCERVATRLEKVHRGMRGLEILMVSRGSVEENRKKVRQQGLTFPVVVQKQWEVSRSYAMFATPVGYLVDETGNLASDVAMGEEAIFAAASRAASPTSTTTREGVQMV